MLNILAPQGAKNNLKLATINGADLSDRPKSFKILYFWPDFSFNIAMLRKTLKPKINMVASQEQVAQYRVNIH